MAWYAWVLAAVGVVTVAVGPDVVSRRRPSDQASLRRWEEEFRSPSDDIAAGLELPGDWVTGLSAEQYVQLSRRLLAHMGAAGLTRPVGDVLGDESKFVVGETVQGLPDRRRVIFAFLYHEDRSVHEVARAFGATVVRIQQERELALGAICRALGLR